MQKYLKFLLIALIFAIVIPQITLAAWWNPFSWGFWNSIFHFQQQAQKAIQQAKPVTCQSNLECSSGQTCQNGVCSNATNCKSNWVCTWGPCVNGTQQQSGHDNNVCDGGYGGNPIEEQTVACSPLIRTCSPSIPASISVISPKAGEIWKMGNLQTVEYKYSNGMNIDAFIIDSSGKEILLSRGGYVGMHDSKITFKLGVGDSFSVVPGIYKVELKVTNCGEGFCPYSAWGISDGFITVK